MSKNPWSFRRTFLKFHNDILVALKRFIKVFGQLLFLHGGDQIVVDGQVVGVSKIEVEELLLTGEFDLIPKKAGQVVDPASFCVSVTACYEGQKIGGKSWAYQLTEGFSKVGIEVKVISGDNLETVATLALQARP